ncbi:MAG TPA: hypothetical protein VFY13_00915, partial [Luteolibacter sp.]|nr:hypothetical protein [Luteolibacter sp.]
MSQQLASEGYEVRRGVLAPDELAALREEATRIAAVAGSACVRNLQERSPLLREWAISTKLLSLIPDGMRPVRMILFDKTPEENWPVAWHQDLSIAV